MTMNNVFLLVRKLKKQVFFVWPHCALPMVSLFIISHSVSLVMNWNLQKTIYRLDFKVLNNYFIDGHSKWSVLIFYMWDKKINKTGVIQRFLYLRFLLCSLVSSQLHSLATAIHSKNVVLGQPDVPSVPAVRDGLLPEDFPRKTC